MPANRHVETPIIPMPWNSPRRHRSGRRGPQCYPERQQRDAVTQSQGPLPAADRPNQLKRRSSPVRVIVGAELVGFESFTGLCRLGWNAAMHRSERGERGERNEQARRRDERFRLEARHSGGHTRPWGT